MQGPSIAAVMRALAVILEGGEAYSFAREQRSYFGHGFIAMMLVIILGVIGAWSVAVTFANNGGYQMTVVILYAMVVSTSDALDDGLDVLVDHGETLFQKIGDHGYAVASLASLLVITLVIFMPPRRWNRAARGSQDQLHRGDDEEGHPRTQGEMRPLLRVLILYMVH